MKYEKPDVAVVDFEALQRIAYIPEDNGAKSAVPGEDAVTPSAVPVGPRE